MIELRSVVAVPADQAWFWQKMEREADADIQAGRVRRFESAEELNAAKNAPGVWEATWSVSGPDGRATFQWIEIDGEPAILPRRVGSHAIFKRLR